MAAVVLGIGALTLGTLGAGASPAQAAPNSGIVVGGVTITPADTQATVGDTLRVDGTWDASEANPQVGDTFTIGLPPELKFPTAVPFDLVGGDGTVWGHCLTDPATNTALCELDQVVADHTQIKGTWFFQVEAAQATTAEEVTFDLNGTPTQVDLPGTGGIDDGIEVPDEWSKSGSMRANNWSVSWVIELPGSRLAGEDVVNIAETLSNNHQLCEPSNLKVVQARGDDVTDVTATVVPGADAQHFGIQIPAPTGGFNPNYTYRVTYDTCTPDKQIDPEGTEYTNEATVDVFGESSGVIGVKNLPWQEELTKSGNILGGTNRNGVIQWTVTVPGDKLVGKSSFDLVEAITGDHEVRPETVSDLQVIERYGPSGENQSNITGQLTKTVNSQSATAFDVTFGGYTFKGSDWRYIIQYRTYSTIEGLPASGTQFGNTANVDGEVKTSTPSVPGRTDEKRGSINGASTTIDGVSHLPQTTVNWGITVPGQKLAGQSGDITVTDTIGANLAFCEAGDPSDGTAARLNLKVEAIDQIQNGGLSTVDLTDSVDAAINGQTMTLTIPEPTLAQPGGGNATGWSKEYQYRISYTTCTDSGGMDQPGTVYGNDADVAGFQYGATATQNNQAGGTGQGVLSGSVAISKLINGDVANAASVPDGTMFTVQVVEIAPDGTRLPAYTLQVPLNGDAVSGPSPRGNGWTFELSEPTFPAIDGVVFGDPVFSASPGVVPSEDGKTAIATITPRSNVAVEVTNVAFNETPPVPSVDIEKWNDEGEGTDSGPTYDEAGNVNNPPFPGDWDVVEGSLGKPLEVDKPLPINFTVSNNGEEALKNITVSDSLHEGTVGEITDLECTFPDGSTGTEWDGPFEVGTQFECTGTVPALQQGEYHADTAKVTGTGVISWQGVEDEDDWNGHVPEPKIDIEKWNDEGEGSGPAYDEAGNVIEQGFPGDWDVAEGSLGKPLAANTPLPINFTISNNGKEALTDVVVKDSLNDGTIGAITDLSCDFSPLGGPAQGTEWDGPFQVGDRFVCTGMLPALAKGDYHADTATVDGIGIDSRIPVADEDDWNSYVPGPSIDIEKWNDEGAKPQYDPTTGRLLNDGFAGDHDSAPGKKLTAGKDQKINFTISNDGQEPLIGIKVGDKLTGGVGEITGLVCTFPDGSTGTEWDGLFEVATQFECTGTLAGLAAGDVHADKASVSATGFYSGLGVGDSDDWHGSVPKPAGLSVTGGQLGGLAAAALVLLGLGGAALVLQRRRRTNA